MFQKLIVALTLSVFVLGNISMALADDGPGGNKRKGKYTYQKLIKACHERGELASASPQVSPADKPMAEWKEIFESKNFSDFGCLPEWENASSEDVLDIYSYFYGFAADSPSPATCK